MKVERETTDFAHVKVTLETPQELRMLYEIARYNNSVPEAVRKAAADFGDAVSEFHALSVFLRQLCAALPRGRK